MKKNRDIFISAVIVAGGKGTRMNMDINKQYVEVSGVPVLARTIKVFDDCDMVDEIIVVVNSEDIIFCKQNIIDQYSFTKVKSLVAGGRERQNSVLNGLSEVDPSCEIVLIHDGARPFVTEESILDSIDAASEYGASGVAVPAKDTVKVCDDSGFVKETPDRKMLWMIQTPQTFKYRLIMEAHKKAAIECFEGTDDTMLVERLGTKVKLVRGSYENIKITTPEDLVIAEAIVKSRR